MCDDAVLFVDDVVNIQRAFVRELHGEPFEILTAGSGEEGLRSRERTAVLATA